MSATPRVKRQAYFHEINGAVVDRFTLGHFAGGILLGLARFDFPATAAIAVGFEMLEEHLKRVVPGIFPNPTYDTPQNRVADVVAMLLGWAFIQALWPRHRFGE